MDTNTIILAFALTLFAGLSTGIGSAIAFFAKRTSKRFLSLALGFSAGVMIYISFVELFPLAVSHFEQTMDKRFSEGFTAVAFFAGMFLIAIIDRLIPSYENPHEVKSLETSNGQSEYKGLKRMGILSAIAIGIHNFPEGMATFTSSLADKEIAFPIAIAIALHNIPEGIAVSMPVYFATGNKRKAFWLSFLSGLAEVLGAVIAFVLIRFVFGVSSTVLGIMFAAVAGIMVFISIDELLPASKEYGAHHLSIYGLIAGMITMAVSLILL
ncbi:MAG: zinc transporter ZupT [Bacteroidales bacterium]|jgi:ZIP family zinc transporter|nr:zinc transporter ZupT [Bacteroidales bacterium]